MMRSLYSGVSGLRSHQTAMDVIGNNIANVNTVAYKSSRVIFSDMFSQMISASSAPGVDPDDEEATITGGINANQIGLGVGVSSIDMVFTRGAAESTNNTLDVMIEGDGFFITVDHLGRNDDDEYSGAICYTRAGNFGFDKAGNLVTSDGRYVLGFMAEYDEETGEITEPPVKIDYEEEEAPEYGPIQIDYNLFSDVAINSMGEVTALNKNQERVVVGRLPLAVFTNQQGLERTGGNYYTESMNSGSPIYRNVGEDAPQLKPSTLEMSNVDLSYEFTKMITTQRGFQANSRIITVSDTMLEELVNLKR